MSPILTWLRTMLCVYVHVGDCEGCDIVFGMQAMCICTCTQILNSACVDHDVVVMFAIFAGCLHLILT